MARGEEGGLPEQANTRGREDTGKDGGGQPQAAWRAERHDGQAARRRARVPIRSAAAACVGSPAKTADPPIAAMPAPPPHQTGAPPPTGCRTSLKSCTTRTANPLMLHAPLNARMWPYTRTYVPGRSSAIFWATTAGWGGRGEGGRRRTGARANTSTRRGTPRPPLPRPRLGALQSRPAPPSPASPRPICTHVVRAVAKVCDADGAGAVGDLQVDVAGALARADHLAHDRHLRRRRRRRRRRGGGGA
jgi:hypothetical protein